MENGGEADKRKTETDDAALDDNRMKKVMESLKKSRTLEWWRHRNLNLPKTQRTRSRFHPLSS